MKTMENYSANEVLKELKAAAVPANLAGMARFAIGGEKRMGVSVPEMRKLAKNIGTDHKLALELWETGIPEAMIVAGMIDDPAKVTSGQMDKWAGDFESWDVCDQVCMNLFDRTKFAWEKPFEWAKDEREFVRRAAFSLMAVLAWHRRDLPDKDFIKFFPLLETYATDERNFVKKAVNWALRQFGKRSQEAKKLALQLAYKIQKIDSKSARWIASDAIKELEKR